MLVALLSAATLPVAVADGPGVKDLTSLGKRPALALSAFATAGGDAPVGLTPEAAPVSTTPVDPLARAARRDKIEGALRSARALLDDADPDKARDARPFAAAAYAEARAHPEDPECPLWLGEALRALARVEALGGDAVGAAGLLRRAQLLDGGRLLGLSEPPTIAALPAQPLRTLTITVAAAPGAAPKTRLYLDGAVAVGPGAVEVGEHHLRVVLVRDDGTDGALVDARFVSIGEAAVHLVVGTVPATPACSASDLAPAMAALAKDEDATFAVGCPRWARAVPRADGGLQLHRCGPNRCTKGVVWVAPDVTSKPPPPPPPATPWLRSPWTWAAIGVGVAAAAGLTAWGFGAFDRKDPPAPTWRWEPAR